jgi:hypothetical protein
MPAARAEEADAAAAGGALGLTVGDCVGAASSADSIKHHAITTAGRSIVSPLIVPDMIAPTRNPAMIPMVTFRSA